MVGALGKVFGMEVGVSAKLGIATALFDLFRRVILEVVENFFNDLIGDRFGFLWGDPQEGGSVPTGSTRQVIR